MKRSILVAVAFVLLAYLVSAQNCSASITEDAYYYYISTGSVYLNINKSTWAISTTGEGNTSASLPYPVRVYDGQANNVECVRYPQWSSLANGVLTFRSWINQASGSGMWITETWSTGGDLITCSIAFENGAPPAVQAQFRVVMDLPLFYNTPGVFRVPCRTHEGCSIASNAVAPSYHRWRWALYSTSMVSIQQICQVVNTRSAPNTACAFSLVGKLVRGMLAWPVGTPVCIICSRLEVEGG